MHELPIAKTIYRSVMKKAVECGASAVVRVVIEAGELREYVEPILQRYWDYISVGSIAAGAKIELITLPATVRCERCAEIYALDMEDLEASRCPKCGHDSGELLTGRELRIKGMEIN